MNRLTTKLFYAGAFGAAVAVQYAYAKFIERMTEKTMEIQFESKLDCMAVAKARDICIMRVHDGVYPTPFHAQSDLEQEIELQRIAIREE